MRPSASSPSAILCQAFAEHPPAHEWANTLDTQRSYELIAKYVMPRYQGQAQATLNAIERAKALRGDLVEKQRAAIEIVTAKHEAEKAARRA